MLAAQSVSLGHRGVMVAGGFESMSNVPYYLPQARNGLRLGNGTIVDGEITEQVHRRHIFLLHNMNVSKNILRMTQRAIFFSFNGHSGIVHDGLWDVYNDHHMGICAEKCSETYAINREAQDKHAAESYERAAMAWEKVDADVSSVDLYIRVVLCVSNVVVSSCCFCPPVDPSVAGCL